MRVPFIDLKAQFDHLETEIRQSIDKVLVHGQFIMGPEVKELEEELARYCGVRRAVTCSSGTDALLLTLLAKEVGPGDAVITSPFTFIATAEVISLVGATPVFVDVEATTYNMDPDGLNAAIASAREKGLTPKAVIPVDIFGTPTSYEEIREVAEREDLFVLQDAAQSFGGSYHGQPVGAQGDAAATSFFPAKPLGCYGDGGAVLTDDDALAERIQSLRVHGKGSDKYDNVRIGTNARLDTMQAAVLLPKLANLSAEIEKRQKVAERYTAALQDLVKTPVVPRHCMSAWAQYSVMHEDRDLIQSVLRERSIPSVIYYPRPLHLQTAFQSLGYGEGSFPVSEHTSKQILSLPMHPYMNVDTQDYIIEAVVSALERR